MYVPTVTMVVMVQSVLFKPLIVSNITFTTYIILGNTLWYREDICNNPPQRSVKTSTPTVPDLYMQLALQYRVLSEIHAQLGEAIVREQ